MTWSESGPASPGSVTDMNLQKIQTILTGAAAGVILSIPVVLLLRMREVPLLSVSMALLCVLLAAMMQCLSAAEKWTGSVFAVQLTAGIVSVFIGILYAYAVSRNAAAFRSISMPAAVSHIPGLLVCAAQKIMKDRKKG